ncbi:SusC/RagA family TonB-linked outer membrane protein [Parapedobacter tibetensis]|uniref:SusC/RagA family TonB-linked outer membrane protein n=1 Tax=Parapedobacter tibetensis TaxID=2972951 RepID=UPI00214D70D7|nr:TonB-dependent receptor [Parapedobacter tibetensis]
MKPIKLVFNIGSLFLWILLGCSTALAAVAQQTITGKVTSSDGTPLSGATVEVKNGTQKTGTDAAGAFSLSASTDATLIVSYIGYSTQEIPLAGRSTLTIILESSFNDLDEVVVVGYTSQKRNTISGAVGSVNMNDAEKRRVPDVAQLLQGQVAGVQVTQSTGAPGDPIDIRIRGVGTIGNNNPLYVIDGIPSTNFSFVNPQEIETISVLKDASAAAMYGARAAAGVVLITTKKGKAGRTAIDVNYFNGVQQVTNLPTMLNTQQYLNKVEEAWNNAGYTGTNPYTADKSRTDLANTDWLDELFESGHSQNLQVTASGGNEKTQFLLSAGYYKQDGIVVYDNDRYQRLNFRVNLNSELSKRIKVGTNLQFSHEQRDPLSSRGDAPGIIRHALLRPPVLSVYKDASDPTYTTDDPFTDLPFYVGPGNFQNSKYENTQNPIALAYFTDNTQKQFKTFGNVFAEVDILGDNSLKFRTNVGVDLNFNHNKAFYRNFGDDDGGGNDPDRGQGRQNRPNSLNEDRGDDFTVTWNNTLSYEKTFAEKHNFSTLVGTEFIHNSGSSINASRMRFEYENPALRYLDLGGSELNLWNGGLGSEWSLFSLFGTATYVYDGRYMLTANLRADASSRFGENNKWGYFPSVSAGWNISRESFMEDADWISDLRLRLSTGQLGNQASLANYDYVTLYRKDGEEYKRTRYGNPNLRWESTTQHNVGIDFGLWNNSLSFTADYFIKNTSDILLPIRLPQFIGQVSPTAVNAGDVRNSGFEFGITHRHSTAGGFQYSINANLATLTNEVRSLHPNLPVIDNTISRITPGHPLDAYYGYVMEGIYQNASEVSSHLFGTSNAVEVPGDIRFKDLNNDGMINDFDRTFIGSPIPDLTYGLNFSANYKGIDLSFMFQGVQGIDRYNDGKKITDYDTRPFNHSTAVLGSWNGEGSTNSIPRVSFSNNGSSRISSIYVEDASYLRLKNVEIGYSFGELLKKANWGVQNLHLYVSGQNLFTVTNYSGLDPESTDLMDMGTYPQSRAFLFGVNVTF